MKRSSKFIYAMRALFDIAYHGDSEPVSGKAIAEREDIPARFLEQIMLQLRRSEIVHSKRGPSGGYSLARPAEAIDLLEVFEAVEGPIHVTFCFESDEEARRKCDVQSRCAVESMWRDIAGGFHAQLKSLSVKDLVERGRALGVRRDGDDAIFYVI